MNSTVSILTTLECFKHSSHRYEVLSGSSLLCLGSTGFTIMRWCIWSRPSQSLKLLRCFWMKCGHSSETRSTAWTSPILKILVREKRHILRVLTVSFGPTSKAQFSAAGSLLDTIASSRPKLCSATSTFTANIRTSGNFRLPHVLHIVPPALQSNTMSHGHRGFWSGARERLTLEYF